MSPQSLADSLRSDLEALLPEVFNTEYSSTQSHLHLYVSTMEAFDNREALAKVMQPLKSTMGPSTLRRS